MFGGEIPTTPESQLPSGLASNSSNLDYRSSSLRPWQTPAICHTVDKGFCIERFNLRRELNPKQPDCCCFDVSHSAGTYWSEGAPATFTLYRSGCAGRPEFLCDRRDCKQNWQPLGVPVPLKPPSVGGSPDRGCSTVRIYALTYMNDCGHEGAPGITSMLLQPDGATGNTIIIPPSPVGVSQVNIYRLQSTWDVTEGLRSANDDELNPSQILKGYEKVNTEADFFWVGSVSADSTAPTQFVDDVTDDCLGRLLTTHYYLPPPANLSQVQYINTGRVVGFTGKDLYFSERNFTHAFPPKGRVSLQDDIVAIRVLNAAVFVLTEGNAYVVQDIQECDSDKPICRAVLKADYAYPIRSHTSAVVTDRGVIYASDRGLVLLDDQARSTVLTETLYDQTDWQKISPQTIHAVWWHDTYVFSSGVKSGFIPFTSDQPQVYYTTIHAAAWTVDFEGNLLCAVGNRIYRWSQGKRWMTYLWRSGVFRFPKPVSLAAMEVVQDEQVHEGAYTNNNFMSLDRGKTTFHRIIDSEDWVRLPRCSSKSFQIQIRGQRPVYSVSLATNISSLGVANG